MTEPANGEKRKQAESLLYDLHELVWDDAVSLLMELLARTETAEKQVAEERKRCERIADSWIGANRDGCAEDILERIQSGETKP